ncbi:dynamin-related protein 4C-like isoform X3 [Rhodamnia argentea]|uniref:Dynamin-related protein 4C-like isoform X1 n=1 Tax=Rhodamnia argentea TaxID=178133 RepID=A0A8B8Q346_9MYRT|nr:dynamin-related protein 4C-like isoform X1 [Rhodamnia argentea]XP_030540788.1 dynamin-related protein 4C-like isoform X2 [Rhodamnia argentea]XP_030540789.1 dynamin-related protein 4C-like isoform X3 [Rhodamnia argentea]
MGDNRSVVFLDPEPEPVAHAAPITASYNDRIRPLLDAIDRLRNLMVMKEGIQLPTIVVVGDQSSGKSSVLESLAGIDLPRGQGICTRVPLIMRLQDNPGADCPELYLEFNGKVVHTDEDNISEAINDATDEIAGSGKGISNAPLTLVVKKDGVPDLTMVDLPGITRVPVHGQPENIYEQISEMIMEYIRPEESIILNVLSATVDFSTCESIRMSQMVDKTGKRTLAVVTKADKAPEGLLEKVTADDVNIGLGYVCVRNRIGDETYEEARQEEANLFDTHPLLCKIDKSIVGVPVLAQKLTQIQATIMAKCLPEIVKKINDKLNANVAELKRLPKILSSVAEAMTAFMQILGSAKESLRKILIRGEFDEYPEEKNMHCTARLVEKLNEFSNELQNCPENDPRNNFLLEELDVLEEAKGIGLPNFLPRSAFLTLLQRKVKGISSKPPSFVARVWDYIEGVVIRVLMHHSENYPQLQSSTRRAASNLINKTKEKAKDRMMEVVEMERLTDYTCNPKYMLEWNNLMSQQNTFMDAINSWQRPMNIDLVGIGVVDVANLRDRKEQIQEAFDLKMRITAYWKIVLGRFVDSMALHLLFDVKNLVNSEMEAEIVGELIGPNTGGGIERMLEEAPSVAAKRDKLNRSIRLLRESAAVVAKIMDRIDCGDCTD